MTDIPKLLWYRNDLRIADHPALAAALSGGGPIIAVYVLDEKAAGVWTPGGASRWWLHHSLASLGDELGKRGNRLVLRKGDTASVLTAIAKETGAGEVCFSRRYEPWAIRQEGEVRAVLKREGVAARRFGGSLLVEPERIKTQSGEPYKVYTPFWRALSGAFTLERPYPPPEKIPGPARWPKSDSLASWRLLPERPNWAQTFDEVWTPGEQGAEDALKSFLESAVTDYADDRNRPDLEATSRLSPHLTHGELSPRRVWWHAGSLREGVEGKADRGIETFLKEVAWREFSYHLLFHFPHLPEAPFRKEFAAFPWRQDQQGLRAWKQGRTGFPIVDAGMRQLWSTGWMHNRVRMIVASFLVKDLLLPWQDGEAWFWDTLVDADLANNAASWQWVAGSGADAAPYFRIFNPTTQGAKFDPHGDYVRHWVPELAGLAAPLIHEPRSALAPDLESAGIVLGKTYAEPIIDHKAARDRALAAFARIKE